MADSHTTHDQPTGRPQKLMERVRHAIRLRHYSHRTEEAYVSWIRRYIVFHEKQHPSAMGAPEVSAFLEWLAVRQRISASTQNQALCALLFLYRGVLRHDIGAIQHVPRARTPTRLPVVLSRDEVGRILKALTGVPWIIVALLYGAGLRLQDGLELRVKDVDFDLNQVVVRRGTGQKDRRTMLPALVKERLRAHLADVKERHERDLAAGVGRAVLPFALDRKYPAASTEWKWQFVFPAARICRDRRWGPPSRFHLHESVVQRAMAGAARAAGMTKPVGPRTMRPLFRDASPGRRLRHSHRAGAARACGCEYDDGVLARAEPGRARCSQPDRPTVSDAEACPQVRGRALSRVTTTRASPPLDKKPWPMSSCGHPLPLEAPGYLPTLARNHDR